MSLNLMTLLEAYQKIVLVPARHEYLGAQLSRTCIWCRYKRKDGIPRHDLDWPLSQGHAFLTCEPAP